MTGTPLHWIEGPWAGKLAMASRPRGGDWIADEMDAWHHEGIDLVVSLLESEEEQELNLAAEAAEAHLHGMAFRSFPIPDRQVPSSRGDLQTVLNSIHNELVAGSNVVLHCRQGIGRTGLMAACLLLAEGITAASAVRLLSEARGIPVPETEEQRLWLDHYAHTLKAA